MENELKFKTSLLVLQQVVALMLAERVIENGKSIEKVYAEFSSNIQRVLKSMPPLGDINSQQLISSAIEAQVDEFFGLAKINFEAIDRKGKSSE